MVERLVKKAILSAKAASPLATVSSVTIPGPNAQSARSRSSKLQLFYYRMSFSFRKDWRAIQWGATLKVLFLRSFFAGVVFCIGLLLMGVRNQADALSMPLVLPS